MSREILNSRVTWFVFILFSYLSLNKSELKSSVQQNILISLNKYEIALKMICWTIIREGVGTSTIRTSTGQKFQNVEMVFLVDQNIEKSKRSERRKCLLSWSLLRHHNVENGFWVDHYITKNEKNIENLNFVWFLHFNYLWRHFNNLWHMVLWTTGIKKWIFKNSLTWLKLT